MREERVKRGERVREGRDVLLLKSKQIESRYGLSAPELASRLLEILHTQDRVALMLGVRQGTVSKWIKLMEKESK